MSIFTAEQRTILIDFVSDLDEDVYVINPKAMPGMIGAVLARYSRAKGAFREILLKEFVEDGHLDPVHADKLITRILIAFGDDSVQELESAWASMENVSNVATKIIEDRRLGGYIEQSSRYLFYDQTDDQGRFRYYREPTIMASAHARRFEETLDFVFETYVGLVEPMQEYFRKRKPLATAEYAIRPDRPKIRLADCADDAERKDFEKTYKLDIRTKACDTLRILLPAATQTNVGMHANGRTFEHLLRNLYSSDLAEMQAIAPKLHKALNTVIPRYVQRAARSEFMVATRQAMAGLAGEVLQGVTPAEDKPGVSILKYPTHAIGQYAAMLFSYTTLGMNQLIPTVEGLDEVTQTMIRRTYIGQRKTRRDRAGRALEFGYPWEIELVIDLGIYRDLHRHRMMTQERQFYTTDLGFTTMLDDLKEAGFADQVKACAARVESLYADLKRDLGAEVAQYVVLLGHNIRCRFGYNDREAQHLIELRTGPQGHRSYRLIGQEMYRQMVARDGDRIKDMLEFTDMSDYDWPRADSEAKQRSKESSL